jgi:hypothetical protein
VGIGDLFKRRRQRESAMPREALEELAREDDSPATGDPGDAAEEESSGVELPGANAAELGAMLRRAALTGLPQVSTEEHTVDPASGLGEEILGILASQGAGGPGGVHELDPDELRDLHDRVREALRREGIDPESGEPL